MGTPHHFHTPIPFSLMAGILCLMGTLLGCEKSQEDKLYGRWQFRYVEYPEGETLTSDSIFYSFDKGVFELLKLDSDISSTRKFGTYSVSADSLSIAIPSPGSIDLQSAPYHFGSDNTKVFHIDEISRQTLLLSCRDTLYHFHKF
ncbi:MAG: lipocalin-like domain-containing protein [Porphyromonadaceae bacterium]|nr:lipocalin-like domain-containing protein [Porphyromonadaceae bacterium]